MTHHRDVGPSKQREADASFALMGLISDENHTWAGGSRVLAFCDLWRFVGFWKLGPNSWTDGLGSDGKRMAPKINLQVQKKILVGSAVQPM